MSRSDSSLDWIDEILREMPDEPATRKSIFEISGFPRRETVNSNWLAFYFDPNEEHGFKRLFFDSLLDLLVKKGFLEKGKRYRFDSDFSVSREMRTDMGGFIDIILQDASFDETDVDDEQGNNSSNKADWAIIIENKIDSGMGNNLEDYSRSVRAEEKIRLVLARTHLLLPHDKYRCITHSELINEVLCNLQGFYLDSNDRHLLILKEFIMNELSFNPTTLDTGMENLLKAYHDKIDQINSFRIADTKLLRYVSQAVFNVMSDLGYPPYSRKDTSKSKHFYLDKETMQEFLRANLVHADKFRFYVDIDGVRSKGKYWAAFELYGENSTENAKKILEMLNGRVIGPSIALAEIDKRSKEKGWYHIYRVDIDLRSLDNQESLLEDRLNGAFKRVRLKENMEMAISCLKKILEPRD